MSTPKKDISALTAEFDGDDGSLTTSPSPYTAGQRLTRFMSIILFGLFFFLVIASLNYWDGSKDGAFADLWEYTKLIGTTIIGGVVATYLQPNNGE